MASETNFIICPHCGHSEEIATRADLGAVVTYSDHEEECEGGGQAEGRVKRWENRLR